MSKTAVEVLHRLEELREHSKKKEKEKNQTHTTLIALKLIDCEFTPVTFTSLDPFEMWRLMVFRSGPDALLRIPSAARTPSAPLRTLYIRLLRVHVKRQEKTTIFYRKEGGREPFVLSCRGG